ncbi:KinB-signaling pathway activation protein [Bacillus sp. HMF5848]|uniref:KinB-signaling pathway activation protein n=1 Tax=Bacillus sp. HMF5848 TaxID=2495421 RepID=UPI000F7A915A|nr:KinB-signaling pathway activation protein [Bacillus sp. HMF5848]RSK25587.1 KinB-signaling pathway activation protein [Bacillus sp. HMF5848]
MKSRNWVRLFISTLFFGGLATGLTGIIVRWSDYRGFLEIGDFGEFISAFMWLFGLGLLFSIVSQMGFFAYLFVHRFGLAIFRSMWSSVQVVLIVFVLFDLIYFRYQAFATEAETILHYVWPAAVVLLFGLLIAYMKANQTNQKAFIPALFFMTVVTILEWVPVLRVNESDWLYFMLVPLLVCNAYQLLLLHKLNTSTKNNKVSVTA